MAVQDRILELIEHKKLNKNSFSKAIGVSPQTLHHIVGGRRTKPSFEVLQKIMQTYSDISPNWMITGQGEMLIRNVKTHYPEPDDIEPDWVSEHKLASSKPKKTAMDHLTDSLNAKDARIKELEAQLAKKE